MLNTEVQQSLNVPATIVQPSLTGNLWYVVFLLLVRHLHLWGPIEHGMKLAALPAKQNPNDPQGPAQPDPPLAKTNEGGVF